MTTLSADSLILDPARYAAERTARRAAMMPVRAARRIRCGETVVLEFENASTLKYQVQEMLYAERVTDAATARHEVEVYARLLPGSHALCATFLVELTDEGTVRAELQRLRGLHHVVRMRIGDRSIGAVEIPGPDESGPSEETHSVHFLRFTFDDAARESFCDAATPVSLHIDHPQYHGDAVVDGPARESLLADLCGE